MTSPLPPGTYTLSETVDNPDGDRRTKNDWRRFRTWEKGMLFYSDTRAIRSRCSVDGDWHLHLEHPIVQRLRPFLVPVREEPVDVLIRMFPSPGDAALTLLNALARRGVLTPELLTELIEAYQDDRLD